MGENALPTQIWIKSNVSSGKLASVHPEKWKHTLYSSAHNFSHSYNRSSVSSLTLTPQQYTNQLLMLCCVTST